MAFGSQSGDLDKLAETGTNICHNCSSNFRLRSGVAPLNRFEAKGINTAIGLDEAGINDDRDMLQEMRMVLRAHREPGMDDRVPTMAQVFRMATTGGAKTTPFGAHLGALEIGKAADMVLIDWKQISYPYLDAEMPVLDAVIQRAKTEGVKTVIASRRDRLSGRQVHQGRPRRSSAAIVGVAQASAEPRRDRTAPAVEGRAPARPVVLRRLLRQRFSHSVLPAEFAGLN